MKILFLTSRFPYPLEKGDKLRAFHQLAELSKKHEILLFSVTDVPVKPEYIDKLKPYCKRIVLHSLGKQQRILNLARALFSGKPFQVEYFFSAAFKKKIEAVVREEKPDAIFTQLVRMAEYVRNIKSVPKTLDYQDAFSKGYERQAQRENFIRKIPVVMEWKRMQRYEGEVFADFENKIIISEQDRGFISHPEHDKIIIVPNGVDFEFYQPLHREKKYDLIFSGNMNYPPNIESALYAAEKILPLLQKKKSGARLVIAGASPTKEIVNLRSDSVEVTGWVDDIREPFAESRIHLAPMLISIGLQNKILQSMAMKIPCIVSSQANNAIHAPTNDCLLIADSPEEYVEKILLLLEDEKRYNLLAENAHRFVRENFSWSAMTGKLEKLLTGEKQKESKEYA